MKSVKSIVYRNLTHADFFNINKPPGMETGGGGQAYIDFPVKSVRLEDWKSFFEPIINVKRTTATQGPCWNFPVYSIGISKSGNADQELKIYQRRAASVSITSQKLQSRSSNRVKAWLPVNGFPKPIDDTDRHQCPTGLMVFLASTYDGEVWAGWYLNDRTTALPVRDGDLAKFGGMFDSAAFNEGYSGVLSFDAGDVFLCPEDIKFPFSTNLAQQPSLVSEPKSEASFPVKESDETEVIDSWFDEDFGKGEAKLSERVIKIRDRNSKIVKKLKALYNHKCQITGDEFVFQKKDGINYTEAHHLIPLGEGGADNPENLVVLSPQMHKMLHFANVSPIDLSRMEHLEDGTATLDITINSKPYKITWHPRHAELFDKAT
ncbi:HNH endonuclease [Pseudidiomarina aestuarii]|uniref:HNH endonuclease n=1 Tax=Pseudidiomarina aestuarii TaxID=624146 RepID=UPI003A97E10B